MLKKKIYKIRFLVGVLVFSFLVGTFTPFFKPEDYYAAYDYSSVCKYVAEANGWPYAPAYGTWYDPTRTCIHGSTAYLLYFDTVPTCTSGGTVRLGCGQDGVAGNLSVSVNKLGHHYDQYLYTVDATCTTGGYDVYACVGCEKTKNKNEVSPLGHSYTSYTSYTYKNDGYWYQKCARCDDWQKKEAITYYVEYKDSHVTGQSTGGAMKNSTHKYDAVSSLTSNAYVKEGHKFVGWATSSTGDVVYTDGQSISNLTTTANEVITLYAVWEKCEFALTYNANGGTVGGTSEAANTVILHYDDVIDLSVLCERMGLNHLGWALSPDATECLSELNMPASNLNLYAIYSLPVSDMKEALLVVWNKYDESIYRSYPMEMVGTDVNGYNYSVLNVLATEGLSFSSEDELTWGIVLYDNAGNETALKDDTPIPERYLQTVVHYIWDIEKNEFVYHTTTDTLAYEGETFIPQYLTENDINYPFGFEPSEIDAPYIVTEHTTSYAYYRPIEYKLYFDPNGGSCETEYKTVYVNYYYGELPIATREGYDFIGWFTEQIGGAQVRNTDTYTIPGDSTVYAHWKVHTPNVTYDYWTNGGNDADAYVTQVAYGTQVDLSVQATKENWDFIGWNTDPDATVGLSEYTMQDEDLVLYAIYKKDITATFIDKNDIEYVTRTAGTTIYGTDVQGGILVPTQNELTGWDCLGWSTGTVADASIDASSNTTVFLENDTIFYGIYERGVSISYDTEPSADEIPPQTGICYFNAAGSELLAEIRVAAAPTLSNSSFVIWQELDADGKVLKEYEPGETYLFDENKTLTAKWDKYPTIEAYDRYFTLDEAVSGMITADKLLEKVKGFDEEDGVLKNGKDVILLDFNPSALLTETEVNITIEATDSFGNKVTHIMKVTIVDTTVKESPTVYYTRFISPRFYSDGENLVAAEDGGLEETSIWRTNETYSRLISSSLSKQKLNEEYKIIDAFGLNTEVKVAGSGEWEDVQETWVFTKEDIEAIKEFVKEHGYGNIKEPGAIDLFYEQFGDCKQ